MTDSPLKKLHDHGQSVWYDNIQRSMLQSGELSRLIEDGVRGVTSNPTIFKKAIAEGSEYLADIAALSDGSRTPVDIYEALAIADVAAAADLLRPLYDDSDGLDGYVNIEVSPALAYDTQGTIEEGRRLFATLNRPNIMIKVPATSAGIPAVRALIGDGINANATLLFSVDMYRQVAEAYVDGLSLLEKAGKDLSKVASVASFFVSRVDALTDKLLQAKIDATGDPAEKKQLQGLQGKLAIANAKIAYQVYLDVFGSERFKGLAANGAREQRLLWASTGAKNPNYCDVMYVEELIGASTVNTMPPATLEAFKDHGRLRNSLEDEVEEAEAVPGAVQAAGLDVGAITDQLLAEGVSSFTKSFDDLLLAVAAKAQ